MCNIVDNISKNFQNISLSYQLYVAIGYRDHIIYLIAYQKLHKKLSKNIGIDSNVKTAKHKLALKAIII